MKRKLLTAIVILLIAAPSSAQNTRINLYGSGVFDDKVDSRYDANNYYNGTIKGGFQWGAGIELLPKHNQGIELLYLRQDTKAPIKSAASPTKAINYDLGINYIMLASNHYFRKPGGKAEGFAGAMLGADIISIKNPVSNTSSTKTKFAWGIRGGVTIWASEKMAIKLQAQLLSAVQSMGGGFFIGTGGTGAGVSSYSTLYQFGLGGGLVFNLPSHSK